MRTFMCATLSWISYIVKTRRLLEITRVTFLEQRVYGECLETYSPKSICTYQCASNVRRCHPFRCS